MEILLGTEERDSDLPLLPNDICFSRLMILCVGSTRNATQILSSCNSYRGGPRNIT
jgi:hypothetical protein